MCQAYADDEITWRDSTWDYRSEDFGGSNSMTAAKIAAVSSLILVGYGAAYALVFKKGWWDETGNEFHFQNDFDYALNLDKFGHFAAGVMLGECFYEAYYWAGISEFKSYLFAGLSVMATHVAIDVKDGFAPSWGFSVFDVPFSGCMSNMRVTSVSVLPSSLGRPIKLEAIWPVRSALADARYCSFLMLTVM